MDYTPSLPSEADIYFARYDKITTRELYERNFKVIRILSGSSVINGNGVRIELGEGDTGFISPDMFSRIKMYPGSGNEFKMICLNFSDKFLKESKIRHRKPVKYGSGHCLLKKIPSDINLESLFASLEVYMSSGRMPDGRISRFMREECIYILETGHPDLFSALAWNGKNDIHGKINLDTFISENCIHNVSLRRFAEMSGRSVSTLRRDCMSLYGKPPARVIMEKRLERAFMMLATGGKRPVDVFIDAGFESLAHFSRKFKERYGFPPSRFPGNKPCTE